jgi:RNA polymerase sigma factor FliA
MTAWSARIVLVPDTSVGRAGATHTVRRLTNSVSSLIRSARFSATPVLLCLSPARYFVKRWLRPVVPGLSVVAPARFPEIRFRPVDAVCQVGECATHCAIKIATGSVTGDWGTEMGTESAAVVIVESQPRRRGREAGGHPHQAIASLVLTAEEERVLLDHVPIVRFLARRIHERLPQHVEIDDLVSAGVVGLMDAFSKFDPTKKVQFRSYAQFRIRGAILDSLRTLDWSPRELRRKGRAVEEAIRTLTVRLGRAAAEPEIAAEMGMTLGEYQQLLGDLKGLEIGTLHVEHNENSGEEELAYVPGRPEDDPLFVCLKGELEDRLAGAIANLPDRERLVMTLYYYEEMTMREIGLALGVVESRVSQVHASAVVHLRATLRDLASKGVFEWARSKTPALKTQA